MFPLALNRPEWGRRLKPNSLDFASDSGVEPQPESAGDKTEVCFVFAEGGERSHCLCDHTEMGTWAAIFRLPCGIWELFLKPGSKEI